MEEAKFERHKAPTFWNLLHSSNSHSADYYWIDDYLSFWKLFFLLFVQYVANEAQQNNCNNKMARELLSMVLNCQTRVIFIKVVQVYKKENEQRPIAPVTRALWNALGQLL